MTRPTLVVELGLGSTWQTEPASITWTDVSAYVLDRDVLSMMRGASAARGQVDAGSAGLSLKNIDRRFDPTYTAGPYYGNLKPGTPIRVQAYTSDADTLTWGGEELTWGGEALVWGSVIPVWYGSVKKWPQRYDIGNTFAWVPVECWDGFADLARAKIPRSVLEAEILADNPVGYWPLNETTGTTLVDRSGNRYDGTYDSGTTALASTMDLGDDNTLGCIDLDGEHKGRVEDYGAVLSAGPLSVEAIIDTTELPVDNSVEHIVFEQGNGNNNNRLGVSAVRGNYPSTLTGVLFDVTFTAGDSGRLVWATDPTSAVHVAFTCTAGGTKLAYADGVDATDSIVVVPGDVGIRTLIGAPKAGTTSRFVPYQGRISNVALFDSVLSAARVLAHYNAALAPLDNQTTDARIGWVLDEIDWPTNLRDLEPGNTTLGPATFKPGDKVLDYFRLIEHTEDGRLFTGKDGKLRFLNRYWRYLNTLATVSQITFSDQNTGRGYAQFDLDLDDDLLVNIARYTRRNGTEQVVSDATSVAAYGEAEDQQGDLLLRTDVEVRSLAQWKVATQSTPLPRVPSIRIPLHDYSAADQASVLGLDLGHRVTCNRTPQGVGSAISTAFLVDGIRHEVNATEWWTTLYVSPVPADTVQVFILGTSTLGGTHVLGF